MLEIVSAAPWPPVIKPMLATAGQPLSGAGWAYEFKWDGVRAVAYISRSGKVKLLSRNDRDVTGSYPEMQNLPSLVPDTSAVLDGELVTLGSRGAPSFSHLQRRMHVVTPSAALVKSAPVQYVVFDVLYLGGVMTAKPWSQRRELLDSLGLSHPQVVISPVFYEDPDGLLAAAGEQHLEGIVAKRVTAPYEPGRRSLSWIKTALIQTTCLNVDLAASQLRTP